MIGNETNEIIEELFDSLLLKYQKGLEESMKDNLHYKLRKISLNRGGLYTDCSKWLKNEKATINLKNDDDKCFQYAITSALNYEQSKNHPERISKIELFVDQYSWKGISLPSYNDNCQKFEINNKTIAINILYVPYNIQEIRHMLTLAKLRGSWY